MVIRYLREISLIAIVDIIFRDPFAEYSRNMDSVTITVTRETFPRRDLRSRPRVSGQWVIGMTFRKSRFLWYKFYSAITSKWIIACLVYIVKNDYVELVSTSASIDYTGYYVLSLDYKLSDNFPESWLHLEECDHYDDLKRNFSTSC